jgi:hypothetical protein
MTATTLTTPAARLQGKLAPLVAEASAQSQLIANNPRPQTAYREMLRMLHWVIRASGPLLQTALRASTARADTDALAAMLTSYLAEHAAEEAHHDQWLLEDHASIGGDPATLSAEPGSPDDRCDGGLPVLLDSPRAPHRHSRLLRSP